MALISYHNVEVRQDEQVVLRDVTLEVNAGDLVYLLGRVGSGKSSLMKTFYGELPIYDGEAISRTDGDGQRETQGRGGATDESRKPSRQDCLR